MRLPGKRIDFETESTEKRFHAAENCVPAWWAQCFHFGLQPVTDSRGALGAPQMQDAKRLTGIRERGDAPFGLSTIIFQCFRGSLLRYLGTLFFVSCLDILETSYVKAGGLGCNDHQRRATCNFSRLEPQKVK